jgi:hypothetical protein
MRSIFFLWAGFRPEFSGEGPWADEVFVETNWLDVVPTSIQSKGRSTLRQVKLVWTPSG